MTEMLVCAMFKLHIMV